MYEWIKLRLLGQIYGENQSTAQLRTKRITMSIHETATGDDDDEQDEEEDVASNGQNINSSVL